jgi:riboflavin kinase, archaea type
MELKLQQVLMMAHLLFLGAHHNYIEITTAQLSKDINRSQQSASKHLLELEKSGYITRIRKGNNVAIRVTDKGFSHVNIFYERLKTAIESRTRKIIRLEGRIVSGMGEGAYYMSLKGYREQFRKKLGYDPFPGTLNIELSDPGSIHSRRVLTSFPSVFIGGFSDKTRTYGWVKCYPAEINHGLVKNAAILVLERTHYDDNTIEIIAPVSIKETAGLKNGDRLHITTCMPNNSVQS